MTVSDARGLLLIIDGNDRRRGELSRYLEEWFAVTDCADACRASELLRGNCRPTAVIADVGVLPDGALGPGLGLGGTALEAGTPVIVLAPPSDARAEPRRALEEARSGIHIVHAPVQLPELAALLRAIIPAPPAPRRQVVRIVRQISPPILLIALSLCLWEAACRASGVKDYLVPPPSHVARVVLAKRSMLTRDTMATGAEALGGFLLANVLAFALAVAFSHVPWFERGFYPLVIALKSVPIVAIAPLLVLWIGYGLGSKVAMAAIIAFFPLVVNATVGLRAVEPDALDMFRSWSASKWQVLWKLRVPAAAPYIFSALRVSAALAVVGAIVGELTGARRGVGFTILMASYNVDTPLLFAGIFCAAFLGITMFLLVVLAERLVAPHTVGFEQVEGAAEPN